MSFRSSFRSLLCAAPKRKRTSAINPLDEDPEEVGSELPSPAVVTIGSSSSSTLKVVPVIPVVPVVPVVTSVPPLAKKARSRSRHRGAVLGLQVEPLAESSPEFADFGEHFWGKLEKLYRITYKDLIPGNLSGAGWDTILYFHGTGHCGCLDRHTNGDDLQAIHVQDWCDHEHCATRGILRNGHLLTKSPSGKNKRLCCSLNEYWT